ncbi:hypothetical protein RUND412_000162 [Rhizina undulata]
MTQIPEHLLRLEIASHGTYIPPHLRPLPNGKTLYLASLLRRPSFTTTLPEFARLHLGERFDGDLSLYAECVRRRSTVSGSSEVSLSELTGTGTDSRGRDGREGREGRVERARLAGRGNARRSCGGVRGSSTAAPTGFGKRGDGDGIISNGDKALSNPPRFQRKPVSLDNEIHTILVETQTDPTIWFTTLKSRGKLTTPSSDLGLQTPSDIPIFDFSQKDPHIPNPHLKPPNLPIHNLCPPLLPQDYIKTYLSSLSPRPDPPQTESFYYPPTRRRDPRTVGIPNSNQRPRPSWMPKDIVMSSLFPKTAEYPVPRGYDGAEVEGFFGRPGVEWVWSAWEYDVFPLVEVREGVWWDFRDVVERGEEWEVEVEEFKGNEWEWGD